MDAHTADRKSELQERLAVTQPPGALIRYLRRLGVTREMVQRATGAKSPEVVSNWRIGRSAPRPEQYELLDGLRVVVSFLLRTNALDDDGYAIAMWLNSYPARKPFVDKEGRPLMTPLDAIRRGDLHAVIDAAQEWIAVQDQWGKREGDGADTGDFPVPSGDPQR